MLITNEVNDIKNNDSDRSIEKSIKSKTRKLSKSQKLFKLRKLKCEKLAKSKKLSKSGNSSKFTIKKIGSSFGTPNAKMTFNHLRLVFTKAPIFWHFDLECYI